MIKKLILIAVIAGAYMHMTGCASNPLANQKQALLDSVQSDTYIEDEQPDLPSWTTEVGMHDGHIYAVGVAEATQDASPVYLRRAAMMDAQSQLFSKAPHEYRELVLNALQDVGASGSKYQSIQTKLTRLTGVSGVEFPPEKSVCLKVVRDHGDYMGVSRVCYQQAVIPVAAMNRTIEKTIKQYYQNGESEKFQALMETQLDAVQQSNKIGMSSNPDQQ